MTRKIIAIAAIIMITLSSLSGCGETTNFLGGTTEQEKETVRSEDVYIPIEKLRTLNPIVTKDEDAYYLNKLIYEGLFGFDRNLAITNVLADSYTYAPDGTSITIHLKQGIYWQDGVELTAEDVKFTMDAIVAASYTNSTLYATNISNIKNTKLDSKNPYLITISFNNPQNISLSNFTFPIIPKHQFKNLDAAKKGEPGFIPIGTGIYQIADYNELSHIVLKENKNYHGDIHPINTLYFQIIPEKQDAINLMDVNNISITFSKELDRDTIYTNKNVNVINFPSNEVELIGYNFRNQALKDARVRKAIASAIDTEEIIESAYFKNGIQNDTIYYPNFLGNNSSKSHNLYDIAKAKLLLKEAGYNDKDGDGQIENALDETISINILVNSEDQSRVAAAQIIKEGLDQLLIRSNIISKDWIGYNSDLASGNYDLYLGGYQIKENYDLRFLLHTNYGNLTGYSNPTLDALLDKMESGISQEDRKSTYAQISEIMTDDLPYYCLLYRTYGAIASPTLNGEIRPTFLNLYQGAEKWFVMLEVPDDEEEKTINEAAAY